MAEIKGINGEGLGIDSSIYDDCRTIGNRAVFIESLRTGMFSILNAEELRRLLTSYDMRTEDLYQLQKQWDAQKRKATDDNGSASDD